jgi:hypothetical protein
LLRLPFEITQFLLFSSVLTKLEAFWYDVIQKRR